MDIEEIEDLTAHIWAHALGIQKSIRSDDNFFELGGGSLSMMMVVLQVEEQLGVRLSPLAIVRAPLLLEFSCVIQSAQRLEE